MSPTYDPYDPEEIRRRQILAMQDPSLAPQNIDDKYAMQDHVMAPDEGDYEPTSEVASPSPSPVKLTDAQQKYREVLGQMPEKEAYKPSKWRRFGAALAGGLTGMKDPGLGVKVAQSTLEAPYNSAQQSWASRVNQQALDMGLDKEISAQDIARQRALAYSESAHARTSVAQNVAAHNKWQEGLPRKWEPTTEQQTQDLLKIQHPAPAPPKPTAFEEYMNDPKGYQKYLKDVNAGKVQPLTYQERLQLQNAHDANVAARMRENRKEGKPVMANPQDQARAESLALQQVLRAPAHPEYNNFFDPGDPVKNIPPRIKRANEIPQGLQNSLVYKRFIMDIESKKKEILGTQKTPSDNPWIDPEEEDQ